MGLAKNYSLARFKAEVRAQSGTLSQQESGIIELQLTELANHAIMSVRSILDRVVDDDYRVKVALTVGTIAAGIATSTAPTAGTVYDFTKVSLFNPTFKEIPIFTRKRFDAYRTVYSGGVVAAANITGATNASPIVITAAAHGLVTGDTTTIASVGGNTNANGTWTVTYLSSTTFSLDGSVGNSNYTTGGTSTKLTDLAARAIATLYSNAAGQSLVDFFCGYAAGTFPTGTTMRYLRTPNRETTETNTVDLPDRWVPLAIDHCTLLVFRRLAKQPPADAENRVVASAASIAQMLSVDTTPQQA